ncbi:SdrD B-like domain-containing protein [Massilia mucilaginosa]|nr:SdrD B-like domain-containing protein [Massilia mucilaginosa]
MFKRALPVLKSRSSKVFACLLRVAAVALLGLPLQAAAVDMLVSRLTDTPDPAVRGGTIKYSASVTNNTSDIANDVKIVFTLDPQTSFVSVTDAACVHDAGAGKVTCSYPTVAGDGAGAGTADIKDIDLTVRTLAGAGQTVSMLTVVSTSDPDSNAGNNSLSQLTTIDNGADLALLLSGSPGSLMASGSLVYTANLTNNGPDTAGATKATFTLSPNLTYQAATGSGWSCGAAGQVVTCTRPSAVKGDLPAITINTKATGSNTGTITTTGVVTISGSATDFNNTNDAASVNTIITVGTDLAVTKTVSKALVGSGQALSFTLAPRNLGPMTATSVVVNDSMPAGFVIGTATGTGWTCLINGQNISCTRPSYAVGEAFDIVITATAPNVVAQTNATNITSIDSATPDGDTANNNGSVNVSIVPDGVDLFLTKGKSPNPVAQGSNMISTIRVRNLGPRAALAGEVKVVETLQAGETWVGGAGSNWSCAAKVGNDVTCTYNAALALNATAPDLLLTTTATDAGDLTNTACAVYTDTNGVVTDPVEPNNCASATATATLTPSAVDLRLAKGASPSSLDWNADVITYTLTVTNAGPGAATGVVLADPIPGFIAGKTGVAAAKSGGTSPATFSCTTGATVTCTQNGGSMDAGSTAVFTVTVTRPLKDSSTEANNRWVNTATVRSTEQGDPVPANNTASADVQVDPIADVSVSNTVTPGSVPAGTNATYVLTINNNGPSIARDVAVSQVFNIPQGSMTFIKALASDGAVCTWVEATKTLSCSKADMAPGATRTVTITVRPDYMENAPNPRNIGSTATVVTTSNESSTANNSEANVLAVTPASLDLLVNNIDNVDPMGFVPATAGPVFPDNVVTYTNTITNRGPSVATHLKLTYVMKPPAGKSMTFLGGKVPEIANGYVNFCDQVGNQVTGPAQMTVTCNFPTSEILEGNNAQRVLNLDFRVETQPTGSGDTYQSTVTVSSREPEALTPNNTADQSTTIKMRVDLKMTKAAFAWNGAANASAAAVQLRQPFFWVLTLNNTGPGNSSGTVINDTLPAGLTVYTGGAAAPYNTSPYNAGITWSAANAAPTSGTCAAAGPSISCSVGLLEANKAATVRIPVIATVANPALENCGTATTNDVERSAADNRGCATIAVQPSSIAGFVYEDSNNDAAKAAGETGITGVTLRLDGTDIYGNTVSNVTTVTIAGGAYAFNNLSPGTYKVTEVQPATHLDGKDAAGSVGGSASDATADEIGNIVLPASTNATGYLFGELKPAVLSGFVFVDLDKDAVRDVTGVPATDESAGVTSVTMTLSGTDDLGPVNATVPTGANGSYSFANLRPGTYQVVQQTLSGVTHTGMTIGSKGGNDGAAVLAPNTPVLGLAKRTIGNVVLASGDNAINNNFGETGQGLGGAVYADLNNNGLKDAGEPGIPGVSVTLSGNTATGVSVCVEISPNPCTIVTDANGSYSFTGLPSSDATGYILTEQSQASAPLSNYADGIDAVGTVNGVVRGSMSNDKFSGITIGTGQFGSNYNFGESTASLSGKVYLDADRSDTFNGADTPLPNVTVTLSGTTATGANVCTIISTCVGKTDANGNYSFTGLPASNGTGYTVTETQPVDFVDATNTLGTGATVPGSLGVIGDSAFNGVVLSAGQKGINYLFGEATGKLSGFVYADKNNNGVMDAGETGIGGVSLALTGTAASGGNACGAPTCTATTNPDGSYSFSFLRNANGAGYTVTETQPAAYLDGITRKGNVGGVACAACVDNVANVIGTIAYAVEKTHTDFNFGELLPASVSGVVYADSNQNASLDKDEQIAGVSVTLTGTDDRGTAVNLSTTTAADGSYRFDKLRPSSGAGYSVTETHPAGFNDFPGATGSLPGTIGAVAAGVAAPNSIGGLQLVQGDAAVNYNFREIGASIRGAVYFDANSNGLRDSGEPPFPGVTVRLVGPTPRSVVTGADGTFVFTGLMAGNYSIVETQPGGVNDGSDTAGSLGGTINAPKNTIGNINLAPGAAGVNYLFGERGTTTAAGSIAGTVYVDANKDGKRDSGEQLLSGVTLTLKGIDGNGVPFTRTTQTDSKGNYLFALLPPGTYHLEETQPAKLSDFDAATGTKIGTLGGGAAGLNTVTSIVIPAAGGDATGYDFREFNPNAQVVGLAKLGGYVYVDGNKNGKREPGEALAGVTVTLSGIDRNGVAIVPRTTQTGADGSYLFENLVPGSYTVVETQPPGYGDFPANSGSAVGSVGGVLDAGPNKIASIVLDLGNDARDYDFRELGGSLAGLVYRDDNHNGVQDAGEPGIAGVPVSAVGGKGEAGRATTGDDGRFLIVGLPADTYSLVETHPTAYIDGKETAGKIDGAVVGTVDNSGFDATAPKNTIGAIKLGVAQNGVDYLFGERRARLEGYVYVDANNNGQMDAGETPLPGVHVTMTGGDSCAQGCVAVTGADGKYVFENLVPGRYTLVESQTDLPTSKYMDGKETAGVAGGIVDNSSFGTAPSQNTIAQIDVTSEKLAANNGVIGGNLFGERVRPGPEVKAPIISGYVWMDRGHTRTRPNDHEGVKDWTVTLTQNGKPICTVKSDATGFYQFDNLRCPGYQGTGLPTGPGFDISFTKDGNGMPNVPTSAGNAGKPSAGVIRDITLTDNSDITEQNLPLNPSGVVYDSVTRQPVRGAVVTVSGPAGFDPARHLLGGLAALNQTTGSDGVYQFFLQNGAPSGTYKLAISTYPVGYVPAESAKIPSCQGALPVAASANVALVQKSNGAPASGVNLHKPNACVGLVPGGADTTQYYTTFTVGPNGAPVVNNHLPIDKVEAAGLALTKTGDKQQLEFGESLLYTLTVRQTSGTAVAQATVRDSLPAGFSLVPGTVKVDGKTVADPAVVVGPVLAFNLGPLASNKQAVLTYRLRAGVGSLQGDGINRAIAYACNVAGGCVTPGSYQPVPDAYPSNRAEYKVRLTGGVFANQACVAGKVFVDCNGNSVQDNEELGIPGVRLYMEDGTSFTTDVEGKYSFCGLSPKSHVIKADSLTLPRGSRLTTTSNRNLGDANSIWLDAKNGELLRADFAEGSCSAPVIEQLKARRSQGGTRAPETEAVRLPGLKFDSKAPAAPRQATDSANQELVKPRQGAIPAGAGEARAQ